MTLTFDLHNDRRCTGCQLVSTYQVWSKIEIVKFIKQITGTHDLSVIHNSRTFTRSHRASSLTEHNKSALTNHATQENHVINWSQETVIDREPERFTRWIKKAIHIRKEEQQAMNRDEGSYQLSHAYYGFLDTASSRHVVVFC